MPIRLVTTPSDATSAHALLIRMCEESDYKDRPGIAAFSRYVLNNPEDVAFFLALDGKQPVGITQLSKAYSAYATGTYGQFNALYVVPEYRSKGVAKQLFHALQQEAKKRGYAYIRWLVFKNNDSSNGFFAKQGLKPEEGDLYEYILPTKRIKATK